MKLYVGNLPHAVNEDQVKDLFEQFGQVVSVKIIKDKFTGSSKGFAFVEFASSEDGLAAMEELNGKDFEGRSLRIDKARPPQARPAHGGGSYGGGAGRPPRSSGGYNNKY